MNSDSLQTHVFDLLRQKLMPALTYHGIHHTQDVLAAARSLGEAAGITPADERLLLTAALFHDTGFTRSYQNHEHHSIAIAREWLPDWGFSPDETEQIAALIEATRIPQSPKTELEKILCDADLDYLGRDDYEPIAESLFHEFLAFGVVNSEAEWLRVQINFLTAHQYCTARARDLREAGKQAQLARLKALL